MGKTDANGMYRRDASSQRADQAATRGGVLGVYQRASRWPEQVKAMQLWGQLLSAAIEGREADAKVVRMPARTG